jgi:MoxR-like ATPase
VAAAVATVHSVYCAPALVEYVLDLTAATRDHPDLPVGASPRASVGLLQAARAHAIVIGRDHVTPDDVQAVVRPAFAHRVSTGGGIDTTAGAAVIDAIVARTAVPRP